VAWKQGRLSFIMTDCYYPTQSLWVGLKWLTVASMCRLFGNRAGCTVKCTSIFHAQFTPQHGQPPLCALLLSTVFLSSLQSALECQLLSALLALPLILQPAMLPLTEFDPMHTVGATTLSFRAAINYPLTKDKLEAHVRTMRSIQHDGHRHC